MEVLLTGTLFVLGSLFMISQKLSLMATVRLTSHKDVTVDQGFAILLTLLVSPYVFAAVLLIWNTPFLQKSKGGSRMRCGQLILSVIRAIIEPACTVFFTTRVLVTLPAFVSLPAMYGVFAIPAMLASRKNHKVRTKAHGQSPHGTIVNAGADSAVLTSGIQILETVKYLIISPIVACVLFVLDLADTSTVLCMAIAPVTLGVVWVRTSQHNDSLSARNGSVTSQCFAMLCVVIKICAVVFFLLVEIYFKTNVSELSEALSAVFEGLKQIDRVYIILPLTINFTSSLVVNALVYLSLALREPLYGIALPSVVSMFLSVIASILNPLGLFSLDEMTSFNYGFYLVIMMALLFAWFRLFILHCKSILQKTKHFLTPYKVLFSDYGWSPIFSDLALLLSFDTSLNPELAVQAKKVRPRIYICTTMYREADYEVERLLHSLVLVSSDSSLKGVYLESHIFMDNGCNGETLTDFAVQLVSLLLSKTGVSAENCTGFSTPYGLQLSCTLPHGLPLSLHFKDPKKVKVKKRWSQVMYLNYVIRHRKLLWRGDSGLRSEPDGTQSREIGATERADRESCNTNTTLTVDNLYTETVRGEGKKTCDGGACTLSNPYAPIDELSLKSHNMDTEVSSISSKDAIAMRTVAPGGGKDGQVNTGFQNDDTDPGDKHSTDILGDEKAKPFYENEFLCDGKQDKTQKPGAYMYENEHQTSEEQNSITVAGPYESVHDVDLENTATTTSVDLEIDAVEDDHTYILATDADMDFNGGAVKELLELCESDLRVGGACGRNHPIGKRRSPVIWHQVFEYAKDFWMIKTSQNIIGSVSCCPGCFSLYRASAVTEVMDKYASPTKTPFTVYVKDAGEDRWMTTLMMVNGWTMRYAPFANSSTYCPDTFEEYIKQRRRWILSEMTNSVIVMDKLVKLMRNNECFSLVFVISVLINFINSLTLPGTSIVVLAAGLDLLLPIHFAYTVAALVVMLYTYAILCAVGSPRFQLRLTSVLGLLLGVPFAVLFIYGFYLVASDMVKDFIEVASTIQPHNIISEITHVSNLPEEQGYVDIPTSTMLTAELTVYLLPVTIFCILYSAFLHPKETHKVLYGLVYLFMFPTMFILLPLYSIANIVDQSWGTRDGNKTHIPKLSCMPSLKKFLRRKKKHREDGAIDGDTETEIQNFVRNLVTTTNSDTSTKADFQHEAAFWESLVSQSIGTSVNLGLDKADLAKGLRSLRNGTLFGLLALNAAWIGFTSWIYVGSSNQQAQLLVFSVIAIAMFGLSVAIQLLGVTMSRVEQVITRLARWCSRVGGERTPLWIFHRQGQEPMREA